MTYGMYSDWKYTITPGMLLQWVIALHLNEEIVLCILSYNRIS